MSRALAGATLMALVMTNTQAATWRSRAIPDSTAMWAVTWSPSGVYVGGSDSDLLPMLWRLKNTKWQRQPIPGSTQGMVNKLSTDIGGYINATLVGTIYAWRSEFMQFDPATGTWVNRGFSNGVVWNDLITDGYTSLLAGAIEVGLTKAGILNIYIGASRIKTAFAPDAQGLTLAAIDDLAGIFVAGLFDDWDIQIEDQWGKPGLWHYTTKYIPDQGIREFQNIPLPESLQELTALASNRQGRLFLGEIDTAQSGQVLEYLNGAFTSTGLDANHVSALATAPNGTVYVAGVDTKNRGQVWRYRPAKGGKQPSRWILLKLANALQVTALTVAPKGTLYAVGYNQKHQPTLWIYQ